VSLVRSFTALALLSLGACGSATTESPAPAPAPAPEAAPAPAPPPPAPVEPGELVVPTVNLNTASKEALKAVPGATDRMVHEFEEYRPYVSIVQYRKEIGKYTTKEQVKAWEEHLFVPIAFNDCDAATLAQWPGLDKKQAMAVLEKRPFADEAAFLAALGEVVSPPALEAGRPLLKK